MSVSGSSRSPSRCSPRSAWSSAPGQALPEEELQEAGVVAQPVLARVLRPAPPAAVRRPRTAGARARRARGASGTAGPRYAIPLDSLRRNRRRGSCPTGPRTTTRRARPARCPWRQARRAHPPRTRSSAYASAPVGRSERPLPRPSKVTTFRWRARYGICIFQHREWTIDHVGQQQHRRARRRRRPRSGPDSVALDVPLGVRVQRPRLLRPPDRGERPRARRGPGGRSARSRPRLEHEVERRLRGAAEAGEPAGRTTSRIRASPACAPSASPTSCESEAGVHSSVENA